MYGPAYGATRPAWTTWRPIWLFTSKTSTWRRCRFGWAESRPSGSRESLHVSPKNWSSRADPRDACVHGTHHLGALQRSQHHGDQRPAAKAAIIAFTKSAAVEYAHLGVRANTIVPGFFFTDPVANVPADVIATMTAKIPMGRMGKPRECAELAAFLVSDRTPFLQNGATICSRWRRNRSIGLRRAGVDRSLLARTLWIQRICTTFYGGTFCYD